MGGGTGGGYWRIEPSELGLQLLLLLRMLTTAIVRAMVHNSDAKLAE